MGNCLLDAAYLVELIEPAIMDPVLSPISFNNVLKPAFYCKNNCYGMSTGISNSVFGS